MCIFFFFQAEDGIRDGRVTGVQTCALPIYERRDEPVADRHLGEAEGREPEADRVDPLVAAGDSAARQVVVKAAGGDSERYADERSKRGLSEEREGLRTGVRPGPSEDEKEEDERHRKSIVESRLQVERVADDGGDAA